MKPEQIEGPKQFESQEDIDKAAAQFEVELVGRQKFMEFVTDLDRACVAIAKDRGLTLTQNDELKELNDVCAKHMPTIDDAVDMLKFFAQMQRCLKEGHNVVMNHAMNLGSGNIPALLNALSRK